MKPSVTMIYVKEIKMLKQQEQKPSKLLLVKGSLILPYFLPIIAAIESPKPKKIGPDSFYNKGKKYRPF